MYTSHIEQPLVGREGGREGGRERGGGYHKKKKKILANPGPRNY